jgi:hypothetical protein
MGWPTLPPEEIPSASSYFQTHTTQQIWDRIARGSRHHFKNVTAKYRIGWYVGAYLLALLGVVLVNRRKVFAGFCALRKWVPVFFCAAFFVGYWVLYSFYASIAGGARFPLALALPVLFILARETSSSQLERYLWFGRARGVTPARAGRIISIGLCCALLAGLLWEILFGFFSHVGTVYCGT